MNPGYYSDEAVKDLLAVKNGEIDFLKRQVETLTVQCYSLSDKITRLQLVKCTCC